MFTDSDTSDYHAIYSIPPFLGYVLANIGKNEYVHSIKAISAALDIEFPILQHFILQLIEQPTKSVMFMGREIVFPENLLIWSDQKDIVPYYSSTGFSPANEYIVCRPSTPLSINFMVTERCNTNCIYCYAKRNTKQEMSTSEIANVFNQLVEFGVVSITLTGGDIFARKDWYEIVAMSCKHGFSYLISTKTILNEDDVKKLRQLGVPQIQFSLDSVSADVLKEMLGVGSSYAEKLKGMFEAFDKYDMKISLRTVLCKQNANVENIRDLCRLIDTYKCIVNWVITPAFYSENKDDYSHYAVSNGQLKEVVAFLRHHTLRIRPLFNKLDKDGYILQRTQNVEAFVETNQICNANTYSMSILPSGDCTVCEMLYYNEHFILGNIKNSDLEDIWNSDKAMRLYHPLKEEVTKESACSSCAVFDKCKRSSEKRVCYVDVMKVHRNPDFPDPKCPQSPKCNYIL